MVSLPMSSRDNLVSEVDQRRSEGFTIAEACRSVGLPQRSYYRLRKELPQIPANDAGSKQRQGQQNGVHPDGAKVNPKADVRAKNHSASDRIIAASIEIFSSVGFKAATYRGIAMAAGVSHGLVRYHFRSKKKLWIHVMDHIMSGYFDHLEKSLSQSARYVDTPAEKMRVVIRELIEFLAKHPEVPQILTRESPKGSTHLKATIETHLRKNYIIVRKIIDDGQKLGQIVQGDPDHIYYLLANSSQIYTTPYEFRELTGKDAFSKEEIEKRISLLTDLLIVK